MGGNLYPELTRLLREADGTPQMVGDAAKQTLPPRHGRACPGHPRRRSTIQQKIIRVSAGGRKTPENLQDYLRLTAWMAGTSPAMTALFDSTI
jgi:hypothetical protein